VARAGRDHERGQAGDLVLRRGEEVPPCPEEAGGVVIGGGGRAAVRGSVAEEDGEHGGHVARGAGLHHLRRRGLGTRCHSPAMPMDGRPRSV